MKYLNEFRQRHLVKKWVEALHKIATKPWTIMEVCGGQTHSIVKFGIDRLLPETIRLIHGPGCPVCVTSVSLIDHALYIAAKPNTILCSFGDMLRVPGSCSDLLTLKARGSDVRIIYSPNSRLSTSQKQIRKNRLFFLLWDLKRPLLPMPWPLFEPNR